MRSVERAEAGAQVQEGWEQTVPTGLKLGLRQEEEWGRMLETFLLAP